MDEECEALEDQDDVDGHVGEYLQWMGGEVAAAVAAAVAVAVRQYGWRSWRRFY